MQVGPLNNKLIAEKSTISLVTLNIVETLLIHHLSASPPPSLSSSLPTPAATSCHPS